ncbi:MAG: hypothetical protein RLN77_08695, partial [Rhodospirillales bacterium]
EQRGKTYQGDKPAWNPQATARGDAPKKKKFSRRQEARDDSFNDDRPPPADRPQKPRGDKPWDGAGKKDKGKKSYKVKKPHRGQASGGPNTAGSAPVKRKKPKKQAD